MTVISLNGLRFGVCLLYLHDSTPTLLLAETHRNDAQPFLSASHLGAYDAYLPYS